jgi:hypothetical protein
MNVLRSGPIPALARTPRTIRVIHPMVSPGAQFSLGYTRIDTEGIACISCHNTLPSSGGLSVGRTIRELRLHLSGSATTCPDLMPIFSGFPSLSVLTVSGFAPKCPSTSLIRPLVYNALTHLKLYEDFASTVQYLLRRGGPPGPPR